MGYLAALRLVYVNGKGWEGVEFGSEIGSPKNVETVLAQSAESRANVKSVGFGLMGLVQSMI